MTTADAFHVDRRVAIALDALDPAEREQVGNLVRDKERFLAFLDKPGHVKRLSTAKPFYALRVSPELRLIYQRLGGGIEVLDLMGQATLERYGTAPARARTPVRTAGKAKKPANGS